MRANVRMPSYSAKLLHRTERPHRGIVLHGHMPRKSATIYKYSVIANPAIVADVRVGHDEVVASNSSDATPLNRAPIYRGKLVKFVGISDFQRYPLALVSQILRIAADNGKGINVVLTSKPRWTLHHCMVVENAAVAQLDFHADHCEGSDFYNTSDPRGGGNVGPRINFAH